MNILGINAYHGDSSACLVVNGKLVAAAEEERFRRLKHWAGFPDHAVRYCLKSAGLRAMDLHHVALNRDPNANLLKKALFAFSNRPSLSAVNDRIKNSLKVKEVRPALASALLVGENEIRAQIRHVEHHHAHLASAFFVSPFESAAVVSVDGFGDFVSAMWGSGQGNRLHVEDTTHFPHSLGLFYLAVTQHLGFTNYGDEYKVMGLASYGRPVFLDKMRKLVLLKKEGRFELDLDYFVHHSEGVSMLWENGEPKIGRVFAPMFNDLLGLQRMSDGPVEQRHMDLAASAQAMYEEAFFHILNRAQEVTQAKALCLAGGCAMNSVANGLIFKKTPFKDVYVQAAAGDAGGAIGAAFHVWNSELGNPRSFVMDHAYWGPDVDPVRVDEILAGNKEEIEAQGCRVTRKSPSAAVADAAQAIADGKVLGWFQGRMEIGPRALGNRSILCDPRRADMKDILNLKIKRRESFRPFAPSILREETKNWFETDYDVPFMMQVYQIREEKRALIPAVTHVNGSGRLQTVTTAQNPLYHALISEFGRITGVPILLNTSFNENEPIVCDPVEALNCFLRTKMDVLVLGEAYIERTGA
jgi:carbamoyltransferase